MASDPRKAALEPGTIYQGIITGVTDYGFFVEFMSGGQLQSGLVHLSEIWTNLRLNPFHYFEESMEVPVKYVGKQSRGNAFSSLKAGYVPKRLDSGEESPEERKIVKRTIVKGLVSVPRGPERIRAIMRELEQSILDLPDHERVADDYRSAIAKAINQIESFDVKGALQVLRDAVS